MHIVVANKQEKDVVQNKLDDLCSIDADYFDMSDEPEIVRNIVEKFFGIKVVIDPKEKAVK